MSDTDDIMDIDPLLLTLDDPRLAGVIAKHRKAREMFESGMSKTKAVKESGPKLSSGDLLSRIGLIKAPAAKPTIKRRI